MTRSVAIRQEISALVKNAEEIEKNEKLTEEHKEQLKDIAEKLTELNKELQDAETIENAQRNMGGGKTVGGTKKEAAARTLGEHFINQVGKELAKASGTFSISSTEFVNAVEPHLTGDNDNALSPALTDVDRTVVAPYRRTTITDLLPAREIKGNALTYFIQTTKPEKVGTVAEGAKKHQRRYEYKSATDPVTKVAAFTKISDEMKEDAQFIVDEINTSLVYDVELGEEYQILNGNGTSPNMRGILQRTGIQTESAANLDDNLDALFRARTKINTVTGKHADGLIIHPIDYQRERLRKDANGQYLAGGAFQNAYGNGTFKTDPDIWALPTLVTEAIPQGTALVGAFRQGAKRLKKGGMRVESTNSNGEDFENNMITIRAEKRSGLAVRIPQAFVKVTLRAQA